MLREGAYIIMLAGGCEGDPRRSGGGRSGGGGGDVARIEFGPGHL